MRYDNGRALENISQNGALCRFSEGCFTISFTDLIESTETADAQNVGVLILHNNQTN